MNPAKSAHRLLTGTGLGLLLVSGLGLISGNMSVEKPDIGLIIPLVGIILLALSGPTGRGEGPLAGYFPNENKSSMAIRVENELNDSLKEEDVGNAWAKLEHTMLSKELEEE